MELQLQRLRQKKIKKAEGTSKPKHFMATALIPRRVLRVEGPIVVSVRGVSGSRGDPVSVTGVGRSPKGWRIVRRVSGSAAYSFPVTSVGRSPDAWEPATSLEQMLADLGQSSTATPLTDR